MYLINCWSNFDIIKLIKPAFIDSRCAKQDLTPFALDHSAQFLSNYQIRKEYWDNLLDYFGYGKLE